MFDGSVLPISSHVHIRRLTSHIKVKEEGKDQESIQPSTTSDPDTIWESDKKHKKPSHKK